MNIADNRKFKELVEEAIDYDIGSLHVTDEAMNELDYLILEHVDVYRNAMWLDELECAVHGDDSDFMEMQEGERALRYYESMNI